jgi:UDP-N-acetylglucosamine 2-epimerase
VNDKRSPIIYFFDTRPETIKMAPVIHALNDHPN